MIYIDPAERVRIGSALQAQVLAEAEYSPETVFESSWRDYVFAEVWTRPGLDRRSRYLIAIAGAACSGAANVLNAYIRGALMQEALSLAELREAALQFAVYAGWPRAARLDAAITHVAESLNIPPCKYVPICAEPWNPTERRAAGHANFASIMVLCPPASELTTAFLESGSLNFVFSEMWMRAGLDRRARRWVTLVGVAESSATTPILTHVYGALATGDATVDEMHEFVLQFALYAGWPKASVVHRAVQEMAERIRKESSQPKAVGEQ